MCSDESSACLHPFSSDNEQITRAETKRFELKPRTFSSLIFSSCITEIYHRQSISVPSGIHSSCDFFLKLPWHFCQFFLEVRSTFITAERSGNFTMPSVHPFSNYYA